MEAQEYAYENKGINSEIAGSCDACNEPLLGHKLRLKLQQILDIGLEEQEETDAKAGHPKGDGFEAIQDIKFSVVPRFTSGLFDSIVNVAPTQGKDELLPGTIVEILRF